MEWRQNFKRLEKDEIKLERKLEKKYNVEFDQFAVSEDPKRRLVEEQMTYDLTPYISETGDELFINPIVMFDFMENPFKSVTRKFPIDFQFGSHRNIMLTVTIEDGYEVLNIPQSIKLKDPSGALKFLFLANEVNGTIHLRIKLEIDEALFDENKYESIRAFFGSMVEKINDPIHIKRKG